MMLVNAQTLDNYRLVEDQAADLCIGQLSLDEVKDLMPYLTDYKNITNFQNDFTPVAKFLEENSNLPDWVSKKELIRACDFYQKYQFNIHMTLSCYALPYCYLGANGAQVLMMTKRITENTFERLKETGFFLQSVLNYDHWKNGRAINNLLKTRLLHACVRKFVHHSKKWKEEYGQPVNQEDMAGTNIAFSLIILRGLRKAGHMIDLTEERAYLHLWKVAAHFLGIVPELQVSTIKEALHLDKHIAQRQFKPSKAGRTLMAALTDVWQNFTRTPFENEIILAQTRFLLGEQHADMLNLPKTKIPTTVLKSYNYSSAFVKSIIS